MCRKQFSIKCFLSLFYRNFLPNNFRVYSYDDAGIMKPLKEQLPNFCYFQGYIEGYPNSMVILSTCTGLRGLLQFGNVTYGIEPLESSIGFEHVIYQVKNKKKGIPLYAEKDIESRALPYKIQTVKFSHYVEMHIIVEKKLYEHMGSDTAIVTQKIFQLIGLTNAIFSSFNLTIILSSMEFWIDENKISTAGDANALLYRFLRWKRSYLVLRPHDMAFLLVYGETVNYIGATVQGKMCDKNYAGVVAVHPKAISLESFATILAQLLSLSMGIAYDDIDTCQCPESICIMNPDAIHSSGLKIFSNCSMGDFAQFISSKKSQCLQNEPRLQSSYQQVELCGNGIVEGREVCDCGKPEECNAIPAQCCEGSTCTLKAGYDCADGPCCENCHFKEKGRECRASTGECDVPEYCNGSSKSCQEDFFIHDGHPCGKNQWVCMDGECRSGELQCVDMFGEASYFGTDECYEELNSKKDVSGNCGITKSGYVQCAPNDWKCGKLICTYESDSLITKTSATTIYANISGKICISLEYDQNDRDKEKMWVKEGTVCDKRKVCRNKACVEDTYLNYDCTPETCNNHGVCNNKKHCHCQPTYLPPNCATTDDKWPGGSIDSGNQRSDAAPRRSQYTENVYHSKPKRWPFFLIIPFFIIFSTLITMLVKVYFQRKNWSTDKYSSDEYINFTFKGY
uniref:Disintegrin and metalloproteinase domain-containing protein 2 n=1 Tax=Castor canadensis TaxID=51338 RepID=A0A8C0WE46_CASCN